MDTMAKNKLLEDRLRKLSFSEKKIMGCAERLQDL